MNLEFNLKSTDLAAVEVLQMSALKSLMSTLEENKSIIAKMDIQVDAIKVPTLEILKRIEEMTDNIQGESARWSTMIEDKKQEIIKSEQDHSAYEEAMVSAKALATQDMQSATLGKAKEVNKMKL